MSKLTASMVLAASLAAISLSHAATFEFRFNDGPGEGFNDTTPVTPVGGNNATTRGAQRRAVLQEAGRIWGALLQSNVPIIVDAAFDPLACSSNSATLAAAGPTRVFTFNADPNTAYVSALADARGGRNLMAETSNPTLADINSVFNSSVNGNANCLGGATVYLGFDHNEGARQSDLLATALHEIGHGLGFLSGVDLDNGESPFAPAFLSFDTQLFDEQANQSWPLLTAAERRASATRTGRLTWNGTNVRGFRGRLAGGVTTNGRVRMFAPAQIDDGSSVSHWDTVASPDLLMEPAITPGLTSLLDLTTCALRDAGWTVTRCPDLVNVPPTMATQTFAATEDTPRTFTIAATDADGDPLTFAVASNPTRGTLAVNSPNFTYTPNPNLNGNDTFTVTATDGIDTTTLVTITIAVAAVNDAPTAAPRTATVQAGRSVSFAGVGTDIDGDALTFSIVGAPANGTATASGTSITYTANGNFSGTDTFTYRARDPSGANSAPATVTVTVTPAPSGGGGGGGGSGGGGGGGNMGTLFVFLLSAAAAARRLRRSAKV